MGMHNDQYGKKHYDVTWRPRTCIWLVLQCRCYWSRCINENDVTCLLVTQFVMIEGTDQTLIETYFD